MYVRVESCLTTGAVRGDWLGQCGGGSGGGAGAGATLTAAAASVVEPLLLAWPPWVWFRDLRAAAATPARPLPLLRLLLLLLPSPPLLNLHHLHAH